VRGTEIDLVFRAIQRETDSALRLAAIDDIDDIAAIDKSAAIFCALAVRLGT
jgi:hypothetical protein